MKKVLLSSVVALTSVAGIHAQTLIQSGPIEGTSSNHVRITASEYDYLENHVFAGTFVNTVDVDYTTGINTLTTTGASNKACFVAFETFGTYTYGFKLEGSGAGDSLQINAVYVGSGGSIIIGGTVYGTVDMDPSGSTFNISATNGGDAFFARYDPNGTFLWANVLITSGSQGKITKILDHMYNAGEIVVYGYWDGDIDLDPTGAQDLHAATPGVVSSFRETYFDATGFTTFSYRFWMGADNVFVRDAENDFYNAAVHVVGDFINDVDLNPSGSTQMMNSNGLSDAFYAQYDANGNIIGHYYQFGSAGNDFATDVNILYDVPYVMGTFSGSMAIDAWGTSGTTLNTAGGSDVFVAKYHYGNGKLRFGYSFGNGAANSSSFARCALSEGFMPQIAPGENQTRGGSPTYASYAFGMDFNGTMDADPSSTANNITSSGAAKNGVVIELDSAGNYMTHYLTEGIRIADFFSSAYNSDAVLTGEFIGSNIDLMPGDSTFTATHTTNRAGFITRFDKCMLQATASLAHVYPCGTCEADLICTVTGAVGEINAYWGGGVFGLVANDMCAGSYTCDVNDLHGCFASPAIDIIEHAAGAELDGSVITVPSSCGNSFGSATASAINGIGLISYLWSDGSMTSLNDSLAAGVYNVQISDSLGCYVSETVVINDVNGPTITVNSTVNPTCAGATTGSIDITVTGGAAPVTFLWSNGVTTEDLSNAGAGTYAFIATDANGCQSQVCVDLTQPQPMTLTSNIIDVPACNTFNGTMAVVPNGGAQPYTIQWDANTGNQTNDTATALYGGIYNVVVTDAQGCSVDKTFGLSNNTGGSSYYYLNYAIPPSCLFGAGYIDVDAWGDWPYSYIWSDGLTVEDRPIIEGDYFATAATGASGCVITYEQNIPQVLPSSPVLCMVTVDSTSTQNVVIWDKTASVDADYFKIYREGFCNNTAFGNVGIVDGDSLSVFYDTVVNTDIRNWQYYVTSVDSCGYESLPSEIHRTIHLVAFYNVNNQIRLQWDDYIGEVTSQYNIFRKHAVTGLFTQIDSTPGTSVWSLDTSDLSSYGTGPIEYYIEAVPVNMCYASRAFNQNDSRSNRVTIQAPVQDTSGVQEIFENPVIVVYPNPTNDVLNIRINGDDSQYRVDMINTIGQTLRTLQINRQGAINTAGLDAGVYFVRLRKDNERAMVFKVLVTK